MAKIITFLGNATFLKEVIKANHLTDVYIDESYVYVLDKIQKNDKTPQNNGTFFFENPMEIELPYKDKVTYHFIDTRIKPNSKQDVLLYPLQPDQYIIEMLNRRVRIAKMLATILSQTDDDIMFIDSDVIIDNIEGVIGKLKNTGKPTTVCIPAMAKPYFLIIDFCYSTNFYLPMTWKSQLENALSTYMRNHLYVNNPVDIFIHNSMSSQTLQVKGVCHYVDGSKYCI